MHRRIDAQFHLVPADRLGVDGVAEGVARGLQRQAGAAVLVGVGVDRGAAALGEAGRPVADGHQPQAPVRLQAAHHGAQRV